MDGKTQGTHWVGCYRHHMDCCLAKCDEQQEIIISLKARVAELEAENAQLRTALNLRREAQMVATGEATPWELSSAKEG